MAVVGLFDTIRSGGFTVQTKWYGARGEDDDDGFIACMRSMIEGDFAPPGVQDGVYDGIMEVRWPMFWLPDRTEEEVRREWTDVRVIVERGRIRVEHDGIPEWYRELEEKQRMRSKARDP